MDAGELQEKLKSMIEKLYDEITELHHHREIWEFFNEELPKHGGGRGLVHLALGRWYVDSQSSGIRRLAGQGSQDRRSLHQVLSLVKTNLSALGAQKHGINLTVASVQDDIDELDRLTQPISRWASENIAHIGRTQSVFPTYDQLNKALDCAGRLLQKYFQYIDGGYLADVKPITPEDWRRPFREAWL